MNSQLPAVVGSAQVGAALQASTGTWSGSPTSYAYQWQRCPAGSSCTNIGGATGPSYPVAAADVGSSLQVLVTAVNSSGQASAASAQTARVVPAGSYFGNPTIGASVDAGTANWKRAVVFPLAKAGSVSKLSIYLSANASGQQLLKGVLYADQAGSPGALLGTSNETVFNSSSGNGWYDLVFPTAISLQPGNYWIGLIDGATSDVIGLRYSTASTKISAVAPDTYSDGPSNPFGTPTRIDTEQLSIYATYTASAGADTTPPSVPAGVAATAAGPTEIDLSWTASTDNVGVDHYDVYRNGGKLTTASATSYQDKTVTAGTSYSYCLVAYDAAGNPSQTPPGTACATAATSASSPPVNSQLPAVVGSAQVGAALQASTGTWSGSPTSYAYQWQRCPAGSSCTNIGGATGPSYPVAAADVGSSLQVLVTAVNSSGQASAASAQTARVVPAGSYFGNPTIGASVDAGTANWKRAVVFPLAKAGSVSKLSIYLSANASGQQLLKGVLYADQAGSPGALLGTSNETVFNSSSGNGWYDLVFPTAISLQPGNYWIGLIDGATSDVIGLRYSTASTKISAVAPDTYSDGPSNPFGTPTRIDTEQLSIYATYTASAQLSQPATLAPLDAGSLSANYWQPAVFSNQLLEGQDARRRQA